MRIPLIDKLTARSHVALGLSFLLGTLLLVALLFGLIPDRVGATRAGRAGLAEAIAASGSALMNSSDRDRLRSTLRLAVDRNDDLLSAALRRNDGTLFVSVGDHDRHWRHGDDDVSTDSQVKVPIWSGNARWGAVELRFEPLVGGGWRAWLNDPRTHLILFICFSGFFVFRFYLSRVLGLEPIVADEGDGWCDRWIVYGLVGGEQLFSARELTVEPGATCTLKDQGASGWITVQGKGRMGALDLQTPVIVRYGETTEDEVFISYEAATGGVEIENDGSEPLVGLRYFGPDTWDRLPMVGDHKKQ